VLNNLRDVLHDLRGESPLLAESFGEAVAALLADFERQTGISSRLTIQPEWPARLKTVAADNLYRIISEALVNVRRHSGASSVSVALQVSDGSEVAITVSDDGCGFEPGWAGALGMGAAGMRERALCLGARLQIDSGSGAGTTIRMTAPSLTVA
jgi:signal transduction histidine kinase